MNTKNRNTVRQGQSFLDKVLECTGDLSQAIEIAVLNGLSITDDLEINTELKINGKVNKGIIRTWDFDGPATSFKNAPSNEDANYQFPIIFPII